MRVRIALRNGEVLDADLAIDRAAWNRVLQRALRKHRPIEIERDDGEILQIIPHEIAFVRFHDDRSTEASIHELTTPKRSEADSSNRPGPTREVADRRVAEHRLSWARVSGWLRRSKAPREHAVTPQRYQTGEAATVEFMQRRLASRRDPR
jgi:hypothetical protein